MVRSTRPALAHSGPVISVCEEPTFSVGSKVHLSVHLNLIKERKDSPLHRLEKVLPQLGLDLFQVNTHDFFIPPTRGVALAPIRLDISGVVRDAGSFNQVWVSGIGRSRYLGFGMLVPRSSR